MNLMIAVAITNLAMLGAGMLFFYKSWLDMLRPDWFYIFRIHENDFLNYKEHKFFLPIVGKKEAYTIKGCEYDKSGTKPILNDNGVYTWNFEQGKNKPITFAKTENIDGRLVAQAKSISLDDIWFNDDGMKDFLKNYGIVIIGIILLAFLGYMITRDQQQSQILLNLTRR